MTEDKDCDEVDLPQSLGLDCDSGYGSGSTLPQPSAPTHGISTSLSVSGCTEAEWERCVHFNGTKFTTLLGCDDPEQNRILQMTGYGDWSWWRLTLFALDLKNHVHPLFCSRRFVKCIGDESLQNKLWAGMMPALQLASRMLISPSVLSFLTRIRYGCEIEVQSNGFDMDLDHKPTYKKIVPCLEDRPHTEDDVLEDLLELSTKLKFVFGAFRVKSEDSSQCHAAHCVPSKEVHKHAFIGCEPSDIAADSNEKHYIVINEAYGHYFKYSDQRTTYRDQKTQWFLAMTLVHEHTHACYARDRTDGFEDDLEPIYDPQHMVDRGNGDPELGHQLDYILYGVWTNNIMHPQLGAFSEH